MEQEVATAIGRRPPPSLYEVVGGTSFFTRLVDLFYAGVEHDPVLRPLYPDDLGPPRHRLAGFLSQYWGGPADYSAERGHPQLRMRHAPFPVGTAERDAWLGRMRAALAVVLPDGDSDDEPDAVPADVPADVPPGLDDATRTRLRATLTEYFETAADHLVNRREPA